MLVDREEDQDEPRDAAAVDRRDDEWPSAASAPARSAAELAEARDDHPGQRLGGGVDRLVGPDPVSTSAIGRGHDPDDEQRADELDGRRRRPAPTRADPRLVPARAGAAT